MKFWDASSIVALLVEDAFTTAMMALLEGDSGMIAWWGTPVECVSALARQQREGTLDQEAMVAAVTRLRELQKAWHEVEPTELVRERAERLLRVHPLRAADSLQLAAAVVAADNRPSQLGIVCNDDRLTEAAQREGFTVITG